MQSTKQVQEMRSSGEQYQVIMRVVVGSFKAVIANRFLLWIILVFQILILAGIFSLLIR